MTTTRCWQFTLFGTPRLHRPDGTPMPCERKHLALMAFLAVEGPTRRTKMASLLYPETPEGAARNNLVHILRRLTRTYGADLVTGQETLTLGSDVHVDVHHWNHVQDPRGVSIEPLLQGVDFDDMPDLDEWLFVQRERFDTLRGGHLLHAAQELEGQGRLFDAVTVTERALELNGLSEDAYRRLMRLHYLNGDRPAALRAYQRCKEALARELGLLPLPETERLACEIDRGSTTEPFAFQTPRLPLAVLRPPRLVGRHDALTRMQRAWQEGQVIVVSGDAGVGKSRVVQDFVASKGTVLRVEARPGDMLVPYATLTRSLREILAGQPDLPLEPWMRRALSRLLPELVLDEGASEHDEARMHAALRALFDVGTRDVTAIVYEDLHYADQASLEASFVLISAAFPLGRERGMPHVICTVRRGELGEAAALLLERARDADHAAQIHLEPLGEDDTLALLGQLEWPAARDFGAQLARFTGGNPLFLLETVRHLMETRQDHVLPGALPIPEKVRQIIERRLTRLSAGALQAARAASILQSDFNVELIAEVLGAPILNVASHWEELEVAHVVQGERFAHDLIFEAVQQGIPQAVRRLLHRSAARTLTRHGASAARVASHWQHGGEVREAAPLLLRAAQEALSTLRSHEAVGFYEQAATLYETLGEVDAAFDARAAAVEGTWRTEHVGELDRLVRMLADTARTAAQRARAFRAQATRHVAYLQGGPAEHAALAGLGALAEEGGTALHAPLHAALLRELLQARAMQRREAEALATVEDVVRAHEKLSLAEQAQGEWAVGMALVRLERYAQAVPPLEKAIAAFERMGDAYQAAWAVHHLANNLEALNEHERAFTLRRALDRRLSSGPDTPSLWWQNIARQGTLFTRAREYTRALEWLHRALAYARSVGEPCGPLHRGLADVYWALGELDECEAALDRALSQPSPTDPGRDVPWLFKGLIAGRTGRLPEARAALERAEHLLADTNLTYSQGRLRLAHAELFAENALDNAERAVQFARLHKHEDLLTLALCVKAELLLNGGQVSAALRDSAAAAERLPRHASREDYARPLLTYHRVLTHLGDAEASAPLKAAAAWLRDMEPRVPEEHRATFLHRHPTHRALLLALVKDSGSLGDVTERS